MLDSLGRWPFARCLGVSTAEWRGGRIVCRCVLLSYWILFSVQPTGREW